jgi:type II secretory pathway pseudopilin PulG
LLELLVGVAIVAVLVSLAFPAYNFIRAKLDMAVCVANLRSLHAGFSAHLQDHQMVWPQLPDDQLTGDSGEDEESGPDKRSLFWYEALKPYGVTRKTWVCPADREGREADDTRVESLVSSYIPTPFDEMPNTAYRWKNTPWLIERGQYHGRSTGPNMVLPDGQVIQGVGIPLAPP